MKKFISIAFLVSLMLPAAFAGEAFGATSSVTAPEQVGYMKRKTKKVAHRTKVKSKYVGRKTVKGTRWTAHKTKRGTKKVYSKTKDAVQ